jgi:ion channel-forming bestrophin family protein
VLFCIQVLTQLVEKSGLRGYQKLQLQRNITEFEDALGYCERLAETPIPLCFVLHSTRMLMIWLTCLPFMLYPLLGANVVWATAFVAVVMIGATCCKRCLSLLLQLDWWLVNIIHTSDTNMLPNF